MKDNTVKDFLKALGERTPAPGGGAVAALNGAIASAQLKMVCEYTKDPDIKACAATLAEKTDAFLEIAAADAAAFKAVSEAYKTKDEKLINSTLIDALRPSLEIVENSGELVDFCETNLEKFNKKLDADVAVVLSNLRAALQSARALLITNIQDMATKPQEAQKGIADCEELTRRIDKMEERRSSR